MRDKKMTIRDIASLSDVSSATVSRYLNRTGTVHEATGRRIQAVIDRYGYRPNYIAKQLSMNRSDTLGLIVPDIMNPYFAEMAQAIEQEAAERDLALIIANTLSRYDLEKAHLLNLIERQVDGIVLMGGLANNSALAEDDRRMLAETLQRTVTVIIDGDIPGVQALRLMPTVDEAMASIIDFLTERGHRAISFVGGYDGINTYEAKRDAYVRAMRLRGLDDAIEVLPEGFSFRAGIALCDRLEASPRRTTAVITVNDLVAAGILRAANEHGVRVPDDLSVVSFDNTEYSEMLAPALTSCGVSFSDTARHIIDYITKVRDREEPPSERIDLPMHLEERPSVAPPSAEDVSRVRTGRRRT